MKLTLVAIFMSIITIAVLTDGIQAAHGVWSAAGALFVAGADLGRRVQRAADAREISRRTVVVNFGQQ